MCAGWLRWAFVQLLEASLIAAIINQSVLKWPKQQQAPLVLQQQPCVRMRQRLPEAAAAGGPSTPC